MATCFITGATGFVGAHVARLLVERGDRVIALIRPTSNTTLIDRMPVAKVVGDLNEPNSLITHLKGVEELYHVAADYRLWARDPREIYRSNVDGTRNILSAALESGVRRVVYTSTVGCLGFTKDGSPADEETPVSRDDMIGHYKKSKFDAEQVALQFVSMGLPVVIVNPSTPVGPGDVKPTPTGKIVIDFLNGLMRGFVDTGLNLIAVEDTAAGHLLAAENGRVGERYVLGNRNMTLREILGALADITGREPPTMQVPHWVAIAVAGASTAWARLTGGEPAIPLEGALMARKRMFFSSEKAVRELGLPQSSVEAALEGAVKWFRDNGYTKN